MNLSLKALSVFRQQTGNSFCPLRNLSTTSLLSKTHSYKIVVVGGGAGGCAMASKLVKSLGKKEVAIIEPSDIHYYQPLWTLVGAGIKKLEDSASPMKKVLPRGATWLKDKVVSFNPLKSMVYLSRGDEVQYEFLIVALGLQVNPHLIKGLPEAFDSPGVCSNYLPTTVEKTFTTLKDFKEGNAIFTFPNTPIKCAGAPQKIMYLTEDYLKKNNKRSKAVVMFNSALEKIFGVDKYANALMKITQERDIKLNFSQNLIEVKPEKKEAVFERIGKREPVIYEYEMLHITPPMSAPDALKNSLLADKAGYLDLNKYTLQHVEFFNVFGLGDCTNLPTSKTAAAAATQAGVLKENLMSVMKGEPPRTYYNGYTSCPLVTGYGKCILAEFDYNLEPLETFPFDQSQERWSMYEMKKDFLPPLYWMFSLKGNWNGPGTMRKILHFGRSK